VTRTDPLAGGFDPAYFSELAALEEGSFWFRSRNELIIWAIERYAPLRWSRLLEVGCGTGFVLERIHRAFPEVQLTGTELFPEGLRFAADRVPDVELLVMDATASPFVDAFDVVGAFDVLEHIADDDAALGGLYRAVRPGGILVATVPQHPALWSTQDDRAFHVRRYVAEDLRGKARAAGFEILRATSFVSLLLPALVASRMLRRGGGETLRDLSQPRLVDGLLAGAMNVERRLIRAGLSFPAGGSLLLIARKPAVGQPRP